ncbi:uncharacterized mitochondrial protein AtMg00810-like [Helianthus annuus]|uniref:uncharacterized mitochondrial protein AtMg00810-like n=1 Tax=Helianthus annuus TaxID=4232 RepID=UPI0016530306|nr:uncharacterized mitochondrial protein AtMg00810-like [Helianthus annuus]
MAISLRTFIWNNQKALLMLVFHLIRSDPSLFVFNQNSCVMYLLVYVDDLILTGNQSTALQTFISCLNTEFAIKDLGKLNYFLGLEVTYTTSGLFLNQSKYTKDILARAKMLEAKPAPIPLSTNVSFVFVGDPYPDVTHYRSIVGALQYLTITRPDISYAVNQARCLETRRSTYGYSIFFGGNLISWSAKNQPTVARSSCESEYRAIANTAAEIVWLTHLLQELHALPLDKPTILCDNQSAIFLTQNPVSHKRAKHIDLDYHFLRELVTAGKLVTKFVPTKLQVADIFTKSLPSH